MAELALITGSSGFIGRALEAHLRAQGVASVGVSRRHRPGSDHVVLDLEKEPAALTALLAAHRPTVIFHLAGGTASGADLFGANVKTTQHLIDAVACNPGYRPAMVVVGSSAEYGDQGRDPIPEGAPERPLTEYGIAKLAQTKAALEARRRGLRVLVARPFNVIGPGMAEGLAPARFAAQVRAALERGHDTITVGNLSSIRDYLDVRDVARGLWALRNCETQEIVNVCSGKPTEMRQILAEVLEQLHAVLKVQSDAGLLGGSRDIPVSLGDNRRLRELTGETFLFDLTQSVSRLLSSHRT